ncbi:hypothetical protein B0H10DRAFT_1939242 [Mycena sp. CBHHK59/15]|nr:hypothetical protein B0H10DRAFT_1939242 [Mycena sp. CBHHK59/15]
MLHSNFRCIGCHKNSRNFTGTEIVDRSRMNILAAHVLALQSTGNASLGSGMGNLILTYNFQKHLQDQHPQWRQILPPTFLLTTQISAAEQRALGIPSDRVVEWPPPPTISIPPPPPPIQGHKRGASCLQSLPSRHSNKENEGVGVSDSDMRASKIMRLG